jgi:hypothetical protein
MKKTVMKHLILTLLVLSFHLLVLPSAKAQIDTINLDTKDLVTSSLKPGKYQYLIYFGNSKKKKFSGCNVWNREVRFATQGSQEVIEIEQQWYSPDSTFNRYVYSVCRKDNFAPIFHKTKGKAGVEAFNFAGAKVAGADSVRDNTKRELSVDGGKSLLNWELDLEVFGMLPFKREGQRFLINFYHPGSKTPPAYYEYVVIGSEKIQIADGKQTDCWKLKIDYSPNSAAIFWIGKKSREVMKMQETFGLGFRYKVRLSTPVSLTGL